MLTASGAVLDQVAERAGGASHALESCLLGRDVELSGDLRLTAMDITLPRYRDVFDGFMSDVAVSLTRRQVDVPYRMTNSPP